jgi:hypothetical protein
MITYIWYDNISYDIWYDNIVAVKTMVNAHLKT